MKLAIYIHNIHALGGIERVVREHLRIFAANGADCRVFGDEGGRGLLSKWRPDFCILHGVVHSKIVDDVSACKEFGIPVIAVCHFSFPSCVLLGGDESANRNFLKQAIKCDLVATVSAIDAQWWRALGCRAMHVQNPFVKPKNADLSRRTGEDGTTNLIWVGRQAEQKQPSAALAAFARVHAVEPTTRLMMIGGSAAGWESHRAEAKRLGCSDAVEFVSERDDLNEYWDKADVHLLTSVTESFCLVLAEAKAKGIPTAMFDIPFLELVESGKGLVSAPQGDVDGLAAKIVELVRDPEMRRRLGREAFESLAPFNDEAVWQSWVRVFEALKTGVGGYEVDPLVKSIVTQEHFAWNRFCEKNLWAIQMARDANKLTHGCVTLRFFARFLRGCVVFVQKIKAWVRGVL